MTGISRQTINKFYAAFRKRIAEICEEKSLFENGEIEIDESYFRARRVRGKRGRGAQGKIPVFGMLKRVTVSELIPIIRGKADLGAVLLQTV